MKGNKKINRDENKPKEGFYPESVLSILELVANYKKFKRPREKKELPIFTEEEVELLAIYLFFKPKNLKLVKILK